MNLELDKQLCEKYPKIFADRNKPMTETCMCWGFDHGEGWYNIIDSLCSNIQHHIDWTQKKYENTLKRNAMMLAARQGDWSLFDAYYQTILPSVKEEYKQRALTDEIKEPELPCPQVVAEQVKEKFGTLRFYYRGGDDYIDGVVSMAESMSAVTCETCGKPGTTTRGGWIRTLCEEHKNGQD